MTGRASLDQILSRMNVTTESLLSAIDPKPGNVVLAAGTLIEGIGTPDSDLDLYVFCDQLPVAKNDNKHNYAEEHGGRLYHFYDYVGNDGYALDAKYMLWQSLDTLSERIRYEYNECLDVTKLRRYIFDEMLYLRNDSADMAHKLTYAVPLFGEEKWRQIRENLELKKLNYVLYRTSMGGYPEFKDLAGFVKLDRWSEAVYVARILLIEQLRGYTHVLGNTNYKQKWIFAYLDRFSNIDSSIVERFYDCYSRSVKSDDEARGVVFDIADLIDDIWNISGRICDIDQEFPSRIEAGEAIERELGREPIKDPQTLMEFDQRRRQFGLDGLPLRSFILGNTSR